MANLALQYDFAKIEAGCDEAGRGCLAGPVFAAAVILPIHFKHPFLNDSKQLSPKKRDELRVIIEQESTWAVAQVSATEIDKINILRASIKAMHLAVARLEKQPELLLIDGNKFYPYANIPHLCMIKGDARFQNIAAASILAKTHRDQCMQKIHEEYPLYQWNQNQGYPTAAHRKAVLENGLSPYHRKTFKISDPLISKKSLNSHSD